MKQKVKQTDNKSWNNSRWQAWRKTALCEYPNRPGFYSRVRENQGQLYARRKLMPVFSFVETKVQSEIELLNVSAFQTTWEQKYGLNRNVSSNRVFTTAWTRGSTEAALFASVAWNYISWPEPERMGKSKCLYCRPNHLTQRWQTQTATEYKNLGPASFFSNGMLNNWIIKTLFYWWRSIVDNSK